MHLWLGFLFTKSSSCYHDALLNFPIKKFLVEYYENVYYKLQGITTAFLNSYSRFWVNDNTISGNISLTATRKQRARFLRKNAHMALGEPYDPQDANFGSIRQKYTYENIPPLFAKNTKVHLVSGLGQFQFSYSNDSGEEQMSPGRLGGVRQFKSWLTIDCHGYTGPENAY